MRELLKKLVGNFHRPCVYCAVIETRGSTPQKAGAAMLIYPDGSQFGTLGGGCVEAEVRQRALRLLNQPNAGPEVFAFNLDDNYGWDDGLICGGRMIVLADPLWPEHGEARIRFFRQYHELLDRGLGCTEAIVMSAEVELPAGSRYLFDGEGILLAQRNVGQDSNSVRPDWNLVPLQERPRAAVRKGVAYLPTLPQIRLLIVGGGHVGAAVAKLAAEVDFDIWAIDDREKYANKERFPSASRLVVGDIGEALKQLIAEGAITPSVYCLIVTRGHNHDEEALYHLAPTSAGYVGMIGSKRKIKLIYEDLQARGISLELLAKVHAPLGIEIGSRTVPEIAISIVAELIACRNLPGASGKSKSHGCIERSECCNS
ncbi:MAG TPA: XdhC family protein [Gemmataceae bacterium]|nr:XdhC family protein [Gemmataceae bacterium]